MSYDTKYKEAIWRHDIKTNERLDRTLSQIDRNMEIQMARIHSELTWHSKIKRDELMKHYWMTIAYSKDSVSREPMIHES